MRRCTLAVAGMVVAILVGSGGMLFAQDGALPRVAPALLGGGDETIQPGDSVRGELEDGDLVLAEDDSLYDPYTLEVEAGTTYVITMTSDDFDTYLLLFDADGNVLAQNDDAPGLGLNSQIEYTAEDDGEVTIYANSYSSGMTGSYELSVEAEGGDRPDRPDRPDNGARQGAIAPGDTIEGELEDGDEVLADDNSYYDPYTLEVEAGTTYIITMTSDDFDTYLLLLDADGNLIAQNDDAEGLGLNSQLHYEAEDDGEVVIYANSYSAGETGAYQLSVEAEGGGRPDRPDRPDRPERPGRDEGSIAPGDTVEGELEEGDLVLADDNSLYDPYTLEVEAGTTYVITMTSDDFDTYLLLFDADGNVLAQNDDAPGLGLNSQIEYTAEDDGEVTIYANSYTSGLTGAYQLSVEADGGGRPDRPDRPERPGRDEGSIAPGDTVEGELEDGDLVLADDNSYYDPYTLEVEAGTTYVITMTSDDFDTYLLLFDADGNVLAQNDDAEGLGLNSQIEYTAEDDGEVTIYANSYTSGLTGAYELSVEED